MKSGPSAHVASNHRAPNQDLSRAVASQAQRRAALFVTLIPLALALVVAPFSNTPGPQFIGFLPSHIGAVCMLSSVTAYLLFRQYRDGGAPALLILSCGYAFQAAIVVAHLMSFPLLFGPGGLFGASSQTSVWVWVIWHSAFGIFAIIYTAADSRNPQVPADTTRSFSKTAAAYGATFAVLAAVTCIAYRFSGALPQLISHGSYRLMNEHGVGPAVVIINLTALVFLWWRTRARSVIHLWLVVAVVTMLLDSSATLMGLSRYSLGWYASRVNSLVASFAIFGALLSAVARRSSVLAVAERELRAIVDGVADALITANRAGEIRSYNHAAEILFEYDPAEARGLRLEDIFFESDQLHGVTGTVESRARRKDGTAFPIEVAVGRDDDGIIVIARDITQRKVAEAAIRSARDEALDAARAKATFLATMSHEIRTPINAVIGMAELLYESELTGEQREYAQTVRDSADSLLTLINDILDFSKIEAGKMDLESIAFAPRTAVESAADILGAQARKKGLSLLTFVSSEVSQQVCGDEHRIRQILLNLIGNAIKFTAQGSIVVRVSVDSVDGETAMLRFAVTDSGIGMSPEARSRLFTPFVQADGSTSRRFGGTGLGLSISKGLATAMGGEIGVDSVEGTGSTFWFTVRVVRVLDAVETREVVPLRGMRCLIVDRDTATRQIIRQYLLSWGMVGIVTDDPLRALHLLGSSAERGVPYHVVIADEACVDAADFARRVAAIGIADRTKLLLIAGGDAQMRAGTPAAAGYAALLRRPLKQSSLFDAVATATNRDAVAELPPHRAKAEPEVQKAGAGSTTPILLVEDNLVNQRVATQQLKRLGYTDVRVVGDGQAAIDASDGTDFAIILMDCQMPVVDGFEATQRIRERERKTGARTPIIAMTAGALEGDREQCLAAGMDDYLSKPVQLASLREMIERWTSSEGAVLAR